MLRNHLPDMPDVHALVADNLHALPLLHQRVHATYARGTPGLKTLAFIPPVMVDNPYILTVPCARGRPARCVL